MTNKPSYFELLKHPEWQRKRLAIFKRSNFTCENCGSKENTLHVHHTYYERGLKPWEYPDHSLHALCEDCHKHAQDWMAMLHRQLGRLGQSEIEMMYGYAIAIQQGSDDEPMTVFSHEVACGIAAAFGGSGLHPEEIISICRDCVVTRRQLLDQIESIREFNQRIDAIMKLKREAGE